MKIIRSVRLAATLGVASMVSCAAQPSTSSTGPTNSSTSGSSSSSGGSDTSSGTATSSGAAGSGAPVDQSSGDSGGGVVSSGSPASSGDDSGTSSAGNSDASSALPTHGCGQATTCTPGDDLAAPATADGFQIVSPPNAFTIQPNEEAYYCYYKHLPSSAAINVGKFQSWMTPASRHNFILFTDTQAAGADGSVAGGVVSGGGTGCTPKGTWTYATSTSGQIIELDMPSGVGLPIAGTQELVFNIHVINVGTTVAKPQVKLNILYAKNATISAGAMVSYNADIAVPPNGMQDVTGGCSPPVGSKFFAYTTHVHKHGGSVTTGAYTDVDYVPSGGQSLRVVHTTDWENPDVALWNPPSYLTINSGDRFKYDCHFVNTGPTEVTFGETAATGEMCMSIGYYFPAGAPTTGTGVGISNPYCD